MYESCLRSVLVSGCLFMAWPALLHAQINAPLSAGLTEAGHVSRETPQGPAPIPVRVSSPEPVVAVTAPAPGTAAASPARSATTPAASPVRPVTTPAAVPPVDDDRMPEPVQWWPPRQPVGDATRDLLSMQADPERPGSDHRVLGATASRSWQRYLDSFEHPVPLKFDAEVQGSLKR